MKKIINLHFESTHRGPGKVVQNLAKGLNSIGFEVHGNDLPRPTIPQGCLQLTRMIHSLGRETLMGPNLFVLPDEWGDYCKRFDHFVVPSEWVQKIYRNFSVLDSSTIDIWPVGIDSEFWKKTSSQRSGRAFIYFKNREESELEQVQIFLKSRGIDYDILRYGSYEEEDLFKSCLRSDFCVLLDGTESQGIAYMQILSMNVPCFVINCSKFDHSGKLAESPFPATSVPYFDERCGLVSETLNFEEFEKFTEKISKLNPRDFILENFTLEKCAEKYVSIIEKYR